MVYTRANVDTNGVPRESSSLSHTCISAFISSMAVVSPLSAAWHAVLPS